MSAGDILSALLALGIWPALPLTGRILIRTIRKGDNVICSRAADAVLAFALGIILWSPLLVLTAALGWYRGDVIGMLGWGLTFFLLTRFRRPERFRWPKPSSRLDSWGYTFLVIFSGAALLYLAFPNECFMGGSDQGLYPNYAVSIAREGCLAIPYPWPQEAQGMFDGIFEGFPGLYCTPGMMTAQFSPLFSLWLAQAHSGLGLFGLLRFDGVIAILFLILFHAFALRLLSRPFAALATFLMALNPGQLFLARITLTEALAQLFLWGGMLTLVAGWERNDRKLCSISGGLLGATALARVDGLLVVPLLLGAFAMLGFLQDDEDAKVRNLLFHLFVGLLPVATVATFFYWFFSPPYFEDMTPLLLSITGATAASLVFLALSRSRFRKTIGDGLATKRVLWTVVATTTALAVYAYFIRPRLGAPSVYLPDHPLFAGMQDYREYSLVNLARYLSPVVVFAAVAGLIGLWSQMRERKQLAFLPFLVVVAGYSLGYLYNPMINPIHFYAIRRFLPVVFPGFILLALWALSAAIARLPKTMHPIVPTLLKVGLAVYLCAFVAVGSFPFLLLSENRGFMGQVGQLARLVPAEEIVLASETPGDEEWLTPLFLSFDRHIVPFDLTSIEGIHALNNWAELAESDHRPRYFIMKGVHDLGGLRWKLVGTVDFCSTAMESVVSPLPRNAVIRKTSASVYEITGVTTRDCLGMDIGSESHWRVQESGFSYVEKRAGTDIQWRWTDGSAMLAMPLARRPGSLLVDLLMTPPDTELEILVNGHTLFRGKVPSGSWSETFDLSGLSFGNAATIQLNSSGYCPAEHGGTDRRRLGVAVAGLRLLAGASVSNTSYRSRMLAVAEGGAFRRIRAADTRGIRVRATNSGSVGWPAASGQPGHGPVKVGLIWFKPGRQPERVGEAKALLPRSLGPGESVEVLLPLRALDYQNAPLPPGRYRVQIGMLRESVAWFRDLGDGMLEFDVEVIP